MYITPTTFTVADYCASMKRKDIIVNHDYQRSYGVWPLAARSFLIETILLNYSIPKLSLYQVTDIKSRRTYKEIIDGQQRSSTILDFYEGKFRLSGLSDVTDASNKYYSDLDPEFQQRFLDYSLSVDLFISATPDQIREVFRRINSYTVPLNREEQRHAIYQGDFKWFIYGLSKKHDQNFVNLGVFNERQLLRMADAKLLSDVTHAFLNGITTTTAANLDKLYKEYDGKFSESKEISSRINQSINTILTMSGIHSSPLMKPFMIYSLVLALSHFNKPVPKLSQVYPPPKNYKFKPELVMPNLSLLAAALDDPKTCGAKFKKFVAASLKTTNEKSRREIIFRWVCKALEPKPI
jgi:hypothetical protein